MLWFSVNAKKSVTHYIDNMYDYCKYYKLTLYSSSVISLVNNPQLILEVSATYRLVSY